MGCPLWCSTYISEENSHLWFPRLTRHLAYAQVWPLCFWLGQSVSFLCACQCWTICMGHLALPPALGTAWQLLPCRLNPSWLVHSRQSCSGRDGLLLLSLRVGIVVDMITCGLGRRCQQFQPPSLGLFADCAAGTCRLPRAVNPFTAALPYSECTCLVEVPVGLRQQEAA